MKAFKYLIIGAAMAAVAAPAAAQSDTKAVIDQITKVIKSNAADKEDQVKNLFKPYKKDAKVMVGIGRAYLDANDLENAQKYADMAIKRDKNCGDAYILAGDILVLKDDGGGASAMFEQAVYFEPTNPNGYRRYAQVNSKANPTAAVAKLEELKQHVPDYPIGLISAEIYSKAGNLDKAVEYYNTVDKAKMEDYQLADYSLSYFLLGKFEDSYGVSKYGNDKFPKNPALNRLSFFNLTNLKRYDEALVYADALFNKSDETNITESDYLYYGHAYLGNEQYDNAIAMFQKSIDNNENNASDKEDALRNISEAYRKKGDYNKAIEAYQNYLNNKPEQTANDINSLAQLYMAEASDASHTDAEKQSYYAKADEVYAQMADKFKSVADFATLQRAHIGFALDPDTKLGLAKPHYEKLVEILTNKAEKDDRTNERLVESYRYLGYYYLLQDNKTEADKYWNKVLEIDPDNETAKQALGAK